MNYYLKLITKYSKDFNMNLLKKKNDFKKKLIFKDDMMKFTQKEILLYIQIMKEKMLDLK